ncbi:N/A [soil metagenome]
MLSGRYAGAPFGSVRAVSPDESWIPEVQITNPAGGMLGGDALELDVSLAPGSSATLTTQGATKAYSGEESSQTAEIRVGDGAFLEYLPHHLIPFSGSSHRQITRFMLHGEATLLAWEAYSAGRLARGERFEFDRLSSSTGVHVDDAPVATDGFELPGVYPPGYEHFGGYSYLATVFAVAPDAAGIAEDLHGLPRMEKGSLASASAPSERLCISRMLTGSAPTLYRMLNLCRSAVRERLSIPAGREIW